MTRDVYGTGARNALSTGEIRVCLFVNHPVAAERYLEILAGERAIIVIGPNRKPHVGILDAEGTYLVTLLAATLLRFPGLRPLLLTPLGSSSVYLEWVLRGAWGVVPYDRYRTDLVDAVRQLARGQLWVPASVLRDRLRLPKPAIEPPGHPALTAREGEVTDLVLKGLSNKEIGSMLRITEATVKFHIGNVFQKLGITSRKDLLDVLRSGPDDPESA